DSDYIPLAQRLKRMGRYVVAVGVAGATSRALAAACDELMTYDNLPGLSDTSDDDTVEQASPPPPKKSVKKPAKKAAKAESDSDSTDDSERALARQGTRLLL